MNFRGESAFRPVRPGSEPGPRPGLWPTIAGRWLSRQFWIELYGLPGYGATLARPRAETFAAAPRDFRPHDPAVGRAILTGRFLLAGSVMDVEPGGHPWDRACPTRRFAMDLHSFAWLPSLMLSGEKGAREGLRLTLAWQTEFARWSPFAWGPSLLARRVFNLACAARRMAAAANEPDRLRLADALARQARQLLRAPDSPADRTERLTAAALAGCALAGKAGVALRRKALDRLPRALAASVLADGGHASRSPQAGLELLLDLQSLDDALLQLGEAPPPAVGEAIDRLLAALRTLTLSDGRLAAFHGGDASNPARVDAARAADETPHAGEEVLPHSGYQRIQSPLLQVICDAAPPARGAWSTSACAQPLALEIVCGRDRIVTNSNWSERAPERQALRLSAGGSTLTLGERSVAEPMAGRLAELMGPRLDGPPFKVGCQRREAEGAVWLELEHDGWAPLFGLIHQRRLYLDQRLDELRAEERLYPAPLPTSRPGGLPRPLAAPYALRFHLEPGVVASLARDRHSILLRGPSGRGWWFRTDAPDVAIEPSVHVEEGLTRRSLQVVARGSARTNAETKVRWKLSPAGAAEGH